MNKKIKVIEVLPKLKSGGAERLVFDICRYLDKDKFDLTLLLQYDCEENNYYKILQEQGIKIITLHKNPGFQISLFHKINKVLRNIKPDIIHTHLSTIIYLIPYYIFNNNQSGYHTIHSLAYREQTNFVKMIMKILYKYRKISPIAIGNSVLDSINETYDVKKNEIPLVYNGIDTSVFLKKDDYLLGDTIKFVSVGRLSEEKNFKLMIDAFKIVIDKYPDISLDIIGDGCEANKLAEQIKKYNLQGKIRLLGRKNNIQDYLVKADCFVSSSNVEGLPLAILEAMSCGLPIVATKAGGTIDVIMDGCNGYLSEVGDVDALANNIIKLIMNNKFEKFGNASHQIAQNFDIKKCVNDYENLFISAVNK